MKHKPWQASFETASIRLQANKSPTSYQHVCYESGHAAAAGLPKALCGGAAWAMSLCLRPHAMHLQVVCPSLNNVMYAGVCHCPANGAEACHQQ